MTKVGVIGLGMMGQMHLAAWAKVKGVRLRMVADTDPRRAAGDLSGSWANMDGGTKAIDFTKVRGTSDPMELIEAADVDLVDICVPTPFHLDLALAAIKAGKHVLCEKPLARTSRDVGRIVRAAAKGKGIFMPAMCMRFWPEWEWLKKAVEKGTYGKVISADFRRIGFVRQVVEHCRDAVTDIVGGGVNIAVDGELDVNDRAAVFALRVDKTNTLDPGDTIFDQFSDTRFHHVGSSAGVVGFNRHHW